MSLSGVVRKCQLCGVSAVALDRRSCNFCPVAMYNVIARPGSKKKARKVLILYSLG